MQSIRVLPIPVFAVDNNNNNNNIKWIIYIVPKHVP